MTWSIAIPLDRFFLAVRGYTQNICQVPGNDRSPVSTKTLGLVDSESRCLGLSAGLGHWVFSIMPKILKILVGTQMERSVLVSSN